jgi:hypothetical protein
LNYKIFRTYTGGIRLSPPIPCYADASCEIHTMLSKRDLPLYVVAIKSFLRFYRAVSVVVHSDGTLDATCESILRRHIPGCRIISYQDADRRAMDRLGTDSALHRCRSYDVSYRRLVDTELWGRTPSRIIMDADILVVNEPVEVISWIEGGPGSVPFLMGQPPRTSCETGVSSENTPRHIQTIFKEKLELLGLQLGEVALFLDGTTGGFYGSNGQLSLEKIEMLLQASEKLGIPMTEWGGEQCMVIYLLSCAGAKRLEPERYFNFFPDQMRKIERATLIHFIGSDRFYRHVYSKTAAEVVRQMSHPLAVHTSILADPTIKRSSLSESSTRHP